MKQLLWLMLILTPLFSREQEINNKGIHWTEGLTWEEIQHKAKAENKFIFVDAYTTWCVPCKKMDKEVYSNDTVAKIVNEDFISVKVQMDETQKDNEQVKAWYPVAHSLNEQYGIAGYPSFLFFTPNGKLAYNEVGAKTPDQFIAVVKEALTDPETRYLRDIEKFKNGQLEYHAMRDLATKAVKKQDHKLYWEIAKTYRESYLDKLSDEEVFTRENLDFISTFYYYLVSSNSRYFKFFLNRGAFADSMLNKKVSNEIVNVIINKEEITDELYKDDKPISTSDPNWNKIRKNIQRKYPTIDADKMVLDGQITFYRVTKEWRLHIKYLIDKVEKYGKKQSFTWGSNDIVSSFIHCDDSVLLEKAISWTQAYLSEWLLNEQWQNLVKDSKDVPSISGNNDLSNYACLLYKAGRKKEAIKWVELHIRLMEIENKKMPGLYTTWLENKKIVLDKMKKDERIDDSWKASWFF